MSKNHAVVVQKPGEVQVQEISIPKLRDDYILVKTKAVALNPTDWKHVDFLTSKGATVSLLVWRTSPASFCLFWNNKGDALR
jgi:NADPH:quinone reductase-like Zn-dependent oxidoreductase